MIATESNTLSATGSMRLCISSFTETIGFISPQSAELGSGAGVEFAFDEEQAAIDPRAKSPAAAIRFRARSAAISTPVQAVCRRRGGAACAAFRTCAVRSYQSHTV